jgi:hypothetical protein
MIAPQNSATSPILPTRCNFARKSCLSSRSIGGSITRWRDRVCFINRDMGHNTIAFGAKFFGNFRRRCPATHR